MRRFAFLALLSLAVLPGVALAQDASNPPPAAPGASPDNGPGGHHWQHGGGWHGSKAAGMEREAAFLDEILCRQHHP